MTIFDRVFGNAGDSKLLDHPVFGRLRFVPREGWQNAAFTLWGFRDVDLLIAAGAEGPTAAQTQSFISFRDSEAILWPRCIAALERVREGLRVRPGVFRVSGLSIPSFGSERSGKLWTLWVDLEGDEHYMYGVQTDNQWETLAAFADD